MIFRLTDRARRDIDEVLAFSLMRHGRAAADRYELLITTVLGEVSRNPQLVGSHNHTSLAGLRSYSLALSRNKVARENRVRAPAHKLVYRVAEDGVVEILGVVGESYPIERLPHSRN